MLIRVLLALALMLGSLLFLAFAVPVEIVKHTLAAVIELIYIPVHLWYAFRRAMIGIGHGAEMLMNAPFPEAFIKRMQAEKEKLMLARAQEEEKATEMKMRALTAMKEGIAREEQRMRFQKPKNHVGILPPPDFKKE